MAISFPQKHMLANPDCPWQLSPQVLGRLQPVAGYSHRRCELDRDLDLEWNFVQTYFDQSPPTHRQIDRIVCIYHSERLHLFERAILESERKTLTNPVYQPSWTTLADAAKRTWAIQKWQAKANEYSPVTIQLSDQHQERCQNVKVLPLWQGTKEDLCNSICETGFDRFGTQDFGAGIGHSTDPGFFGNGIYFTNSARYAADIYSQAIDRNGKEGNRIFLAWVAMKEPFPVIADRKCSFPNMPNDMRKLMGKPGYRGHDAHYIPVVSTNPTEKMFIKHSSEFFKLFFFNKILLL